MTKTRTLLFWAFTLVAVLLASCRPKTPTPDPNQAIQQIVAMTMAAIPTPTGAAPSTPYPSPTPFNLIGLFCEYQFCIGHPPELAFFDRRAVDTPGVMSSYSDGYLVAINNSLLFQVIWQYAPGTADPQFLLDTIIDEQVDVESGDMDVQLVRDMNLMYVPITSTATAVLPFGAAAAWTCGDRVFAWKVYTPQAEAARPLFEQAFDKFTCGQ
ncbi:MAG: hypothetical protein AB1649_12275 [Chloroflexota bacterium]